MNPSNDPQPNRSSASLSPGWAIFLGQLFVTLPGMVVIYVVSMIGRSYPENQVWMFLVGGFVVAWGWYSFAISRWRRWALARVTDAERLQKLAELTGLLWPKGSVFEKKEFKEPKDNKKRP